MLKRSENLSHPSAFDQPTKLPSSAEETVEWQSINETWWNTHPMRYDWKSAIPHEEFSPEFFREIDRRFLESSRSYLPWRTIPFDQLIEYEKLPEKDVLEIGIGNGTHAHLIATHARSFTGIDITDYAVQSGQRRLTGFPAATILKMDAEQMNFERESFDLVWSWGVIHHSAHTKRILDQIARVLRVRGTATIMVYHRGWFNYYLRGVFDVWDAAWWLFQGEVPP